MKRYTLVMPRTEVKERIQNQIVQGKELLAQPLRSEEDLKTAWERFRIWSAINDELLKRAVNNDALTQYYHPQVRYRVHGDFPFEERIKRFVTDVNDRLTRLTAILGRLEMIPEIQSNSAQDTRHSIRKAPNNRVFVVHGHDEEAKQSVARTIQTLGLEPVILHEQANQGRTIIEKFEAYGDVTFAVVLLTPDDLGGSHAKPQALQPRARQNVIFELGYFIGRLGREAVCPLYKGEVELPSDISGVVFVPMGIGDAWKVELAREMKAAGLDVDLNRLA